MAMYQTPDRACIEFLKTSGGVGKGRSIRLVGITPGMVPQQLYGICDQQFWGTFMQEVQVASDHHPYLVRPGADDYAGWAFAGAVGAVVGCCCIDPDSGNYPAWFQEIEALVNRWQQYFQERGMHLSFHHTKLMWLQVDVTQRGKQATGYPMAM